MGTDVEFEKVAGSGGSAVRPGDTASLEPEFLQDVEKERQTRRSRRLLTTLLLVIPAVVLAFCYLFYLLLELVLIFHGGTPLLGRLEKKADSTTAGTRGIQYSFQDARGTHVRTARLLASESANLQVGSPLRLKVLYLGDVPWVSRHVQEPYPYGRWIFLGVLLGIAVPLSIRGARQRRKLQDQQLSLLRTVEAGAPDPPLRWIEEVFRSRSPRASLLISDLVEDRPPDPLRLQFRSSAVDTWLRARTKPTPARKWLRHYLYAAERILGRCPAPLTPGPIPDGIHASLLPEEFALPVPEHLLAVLHAARPGAHIWIDLEGLEEEMRHLPVDEDEETDELVRFEFPAEADYYAAGPQPLAYSRTPDGRPAGVKLLPAPEAARVVDAFLNAFYLCPWRWRAVTRTLNVQVQEKPPRPATLRLVPGKELEITMSEE